MKAHSVVDAIHVTQDPPTLDDRCDGLPVFPLDILPPFWRRWCRDAALGAGAPVDYTALSLLTVAAGLIGGTRRISPAPMWGEPCVLWTALVGGPASGKTRGMQTALGLVRALQQRLGSTGEGAWRRHAAAREVARVVTSLWRRDLRNMVIAQAKEVDLLPDDAIEPPPPGRLMIDDPRIRAVAAAVHGNPRGVLLAPDALDGWLARTARQTADVERHHWRRAWSAESWTVRHRQLLQINVPAAVSILGTLRPDALPPARAGGDDGTIGRCLFVCPSRPALRSLSGSTETMNDAAVDALARLHALPAERDVPLSADARAVFDTFRDALDLGIGDLDGRAAAWWSEGTGLVLRLAGVLTFLDWSAEPAGTVEPAQVSATALRTAADLWRDYLWPHARAVFSAAGVSERRRHAERALRWIVEHRVGEVSREQIRREVLSQAVDADGADAVIALLVAQGWLQPMARATTGPGRPPHRWQVNPALLDEDVSAISATDSDAKTYRHPERSEGSPAKDTRYAMPRKIPLDARDDDGGVSAISATDSESELSSLGARASGRHQGDALLSRDMSGETPALPGERAFRQFPQRRWRQLTSNRFTSDDRGNERQVSGLGGASTGVTSACRMSGQ